MLNVLVTKFNNSFDSITSDTSREDLLKLLEQANAIINLQGREVAEMDQDLTKYVIVKKNKEYFGGAGYNGPLCDKANVEKGKLYSTVNEAEIDMKSLGSIEPIEFVVVEYQPQIGQ